MGYILWIGWLYATYILLREPGKSIDMTMDLITSQVWEWSPNPLWLELVGFPFPAFDSDTGSRGWPWIYRGVLDSTFGIQWKDWRKNPPAQVIPFRCDRWDVTVGLKWLLEVFGSNLGGSQGYQSQWQCCKTVAWHGLTVKNLESHSRSNGVFSGCTCVLSVSWLRILLLSGLCCAHANFEVHLIAILRAKIPVFGY